MPMSASSRKPQPKKRHSVSVPFFISVLGAKGGTCIADVRALPCGVAS